MRLPNPEKALDIAEEVGISPVIAQALLNRGVSTPDDARAFLDPNLSRLGDPYQLPDMEIAVERLCRAIQNRERIFLHGDYDADGVTSTAICLRALQILKADVIGFVPSRFDGYDLQRGGVDRAKEAGAVLILTSDCGSRAHDAIAYANSLGIEVIVTDHHRLDDVLPPALAVVNPYREDKELAFRALCGAGVAFKLFDAIIGKLMPDSRDTYRERFADLAALGTVADVTPLISENRILVLYGLQALAETRKPGIRALLEKLNLHQKRLTPHMISHHLAPCLNAAGRIEEADIAFRLLTVKDEAEAGELAAKIAELRERSREETNRVANEALLDALMPENANRRVQVLAKKRWGKGVVGPAASRVVEHLRRPAILLSYDPETDSYGGSARTYGSFRMLHALQQCADLLGRFGGHSGAAGLSLPAANLEAFRERIEKEAEGEVSDEPEPPFLVIDAEIHSGRAISYDFVEQLDQLGPFGTGNEEPLFITRQAILTDRKAVGKDFSTLQLWLRLPGQTTSFKGVRFQAGEWAERVSPGDRLDVVYTPKLNEYRGKISVELKVVDFRPSVA
ncbi:MAG: hypothetical protein OHK0029_30480 [Armatimonadaceae bacterium]